MMNLEVRTVTGPAGSYDVSSDPVLACVIGGPVDDDVRVVDRDSSYLPCPLVPSIPYIQYSFDRRTPSHPLNPSSFICSSVTYHVGIYPIRLVQRG